MRVKMILITRFFAGITIYDSLFYRITVRIPAAKVFHISHVDAGFYQGN